MKFNIIPYNLQRSYTPHTHLSADKTFHFWAKSTDLGTVLLRTTSLYSYNSMPVHNWPLLPPASRNTCQGQNLTRNIACASWKTWLPKPSWLCHLLAECPRLHSIRNNIFHQYQFKTGEIPPFHQIISIFEQSYIYDMMLKPMRAPLPQ